MHNESLKIIKGAALILLFGLCLMRLINLTPLLETNRSLHTLTWIFLDDPEAANAGGYAEILTDLPSSNCRLNWQAILTAKKLGIRDNQQSRIDALLDCSAKSVQLIYTLDPVSKEFASLAVTRYPDEPFALFWLADLIRNEDPLRAAGQYQKGLITDGNNGTAWCGLGRAYEGLQDFAKAGDAFEMCCSLGDPGYHGCWGAGRMMEKQGNIPKAIEYYRLSQWKPVRTRADELAK